MQVLLQRLRCGNQATQGCLYIDTKFYAGTLEDVKRPLKIPGETRIPAGVYPLNIANYGDMNARYKKRFGLRHQGMIMVGNVPGFDGILLHMGGSKQDTQGCILIGGVSDWMLETQLKSEDAYIVVYAKIINALLAKEPVTLTVRDESFLFGGK